MVSILATTDVGVARRQPGLPLDLCTAWCGFGSSRNHAEAVATACRLGGGSRRHHTQLVIPWRFRPWSDLSLHCFCSDPFFWPNSNRGGRWCMLRPATALRAVTMTSGADRPPRGGHSKVRVAEAELIRLFTLRVVCPQGATDVVPTHPTHVMFFLTNRLYSIQLRQSGIGIGAIRQVRIPHISIFTHDLEQRSRRAQRPTLQGR